MNPVSGPVADHAETFRCPNCSSESPGHFCGMCGQQRIHGGDLSIAHAFHHVAEELFHLDGKILNSLWLLFTRPGQLTLDFFEGRRVRHIHPIRLFMVISAAYFLFVHADIERARAEYRRATRGVIAQVASASHLSVAEVTARIEQRAAERGSTFDRFLEDTFDQAESRLTLAYKGIVIAAYLSSGVWLSLLLRNRRRYFAEHMVMALHLASFIMIMSPLLGWLRSHHIGRFAYISADMMVFIGYPLIAARRVYSEEKLGGLLLKGLVTLVLSVIFYQVGVIVVVVVATLPRLLWLYR